MTSNRLSVKSQSRNSPSSSPPHPPPPPQFLLHLVQIDGDCCKTAFYGIGNILMNRKEKHKRAPVWARNTLKLSLLMCGEWTNHGLIYLIELLLCQPYNDRQTFFSSFGHSTMTLFRRSLYYGFSLSSLAQHFTAWGNISSSGMGEAYLFERV